ncbi:pentatricopeptide repeat-containing protein At2g36730-like isoform X1 [Telopea speciosissima]|uniref:pentatricopeptide repeat-containing protein At2g36730-like isoform X1 n=1 Tax=Telopea speciosissima TaxID=54955 RepID=UPI001CC62150|nr:pentatricopeptide repeat-containing protein At2g36730-like isoform X1 [Telopea speciosissima]
MISRLLPSLFQRSKTTTHLIQIRSLLLKTALDRDPLSISSFLLTACSISIEFAHSFLHDLTVIPPLFAWNVIIREYSKSPYPIEAVKLFSELRRLGIRSDNFTFPFVLKACGRCSMLREGETVHSLIFKAGFTVDKYVRNTLLRMYAACNEIGLSMRVFDEMTERDVVSWSSMIAGCVACNSSLKALRVFQQMKMANVEPNSVTLVSLLSVCTCLGNVSTGKSIHSHIVVNNIGLDVALGTALLEMYSKCGYIERALLVFRYMNEKNLQSWTVMITALADHGRGKDAIALFTQMEEIGLKLDSVSFSGILCACSHLGLVDEGRKYFDRMVSVYKIRPTMEHFGCMVDLYGRAGMVEEAYDIIKNMPMKPNTIILRSYIGSCRNHGQVLLDESFSKFLLEVEPDLGSNYVLAANVSAVTGHWDDVANLRVTMKEKGLKKVPGCSWVEVHGGIA